MTYYEFIADPSFFRFLFEIDRDVAAKARHAGCGVCGGPLDTSDFFRSGDGFPRGTTRETLRRFSFSCRREGCRKRLTPDSLRFLYRKAFTSAVIVLLSIINNGENAHRAAALARVLSVDRRTIARWRRWWRDGFAKSALWRGQRGLLMTGEAPLPAAIVEAFAASAATPKEALKALLAFIAPWR